jgi:hypothetical protein
MGGFPIQVIKTLPAIHITKYATVVVLLVNSIKGFFLRLQKFEADGLNWQMGQRKLNEILSRFNYEERGTLSVGVARLPSVHRFYGLSDLHK